MEISVGKCCPVLVNFSSEIIDEKSLHQSMDYNTERTLDKQRAAFSLISLRPAMSAVEKKNHSVLFTLLHGEYK